RSYGRPVLVVRAGDRDASDQEQRQKSVPGTVLFPGEKGLALPRVPPHLPWACFQWDDPLLGKKPPEAECLRDGGDAGGPVGFDPEDTVAEYRDAEGRKCIAISNRCCVCVPRFAVLRSELRLELTQAAQIPVDVALAVPPLQLEGEQVPVRFDQFEQVAAVVGTLIPSAIEGLQATSVVARIEGLESVSAVLVTA